MLKYLCGFPFWVAVRGKWRSSLLEVAPLPLFFLEVVIHLINPFPNDIGRCST